MASQPAPQRAASAMNGLAHAMESLYTPLANLWHVGDAVKDYGPLVQKAENFAAEHQGRQDYLSTLGTLRFRAGRHAEALPGCSAAGYTWLARPATPAALPRSFPIASSTMPAVAGALA